MTEVHFKNGVYAWHKGKGEVDYSDKMLELYGDNFMLFGNIGINNINVKSSSLDAQNATITNKQLFINMYNSKAENINNAGLILLSNGSISNSSTNELRVLMGNNIIDGEVSAKTVKFYQGTLNIAKDAILTVSDKNTLNFLKIRGEGKVYDEKTQVYYNTNEHTLNSDNSSFKANIQTHNFAMANTIEKIKDKKDAYVNVDESQNSDVELLNTQMANNDNLL